MPFAALPFGAAACPASLRRAHFTPHNSSQKAKNAATPHASAAQLRPIMHHCRRKESAATSAAMARSRESSGTAVHSRRRTLRAKAAQSSTP